MVTMHVCSFWYNLDKYHTSSNLYQNFFNRCKSCIVRGDLNILMYVCSTVLTFDFLVFNLLNLQIVLLGLNATLCLCLWRVWSWILLLCRYVQWKTVCSCILVLVVSFVSCEVSFLVSFTWTLIVTPILSQYILYYMRFFFPSSLLMGQISILLLA